MLVISADDVWGPGAWWKVLKGLAHHGPDIKKLNRDGLIKPATRTCMDHSHRILKDPYKG